MKTKTLIFIIFTVCSLSSFTQYRLNQIDSLIQLGEYEKSEKEILTQLDKEPQKAELLHLFAKVKIYQSQYDKAIDYIYQSKEECVKEENKTLNSKNDYLLGKTFLIIEDFAKAREYLTKAVSNSKNMDTLTLVKSYFSLFYAEQDSLTRQNDLLLAKNLMIAFDSLSPLANEISAIYYFDKNNNSKAIHFWRRLFENKLSNNIQKYQALNCIAFAFELNKELDSAISYYFKGIDLTVQENDAITLQKTSLRLISLLNEDKRFDEAQHYQKIYNQSLVDSSNISVEEFRNIYYIENEKTRSAPINGFKVIYFFLGIGILLLGVLFWLFNSRRNNQAPNVAEQNQNSKEKTYFSNPELDKKIKEKLIVFNETEGFLNADCTLKNLSEKFQLKNQKYLSDYIRKNLNKTFPQYINELRINYVLKRWKEDDKFRDYSLEIISKEAGFNSKSTFFSAFREKTNQTPAEYRKERFPS